MHTILAFPGKDINEADGEKVGFVEKLTLLEIAPVSFPFEEVKVAEEEELIFVEIGMGPAATKTN